MTIKFTTFWIQYKTYICSFLLKLNFYGLRSKNSVHYRTLNSGQCCIGMFCHFWFLWSFLRHWSLDNQVDLGQNKKLILSGLRYWCIIWLLWIGNSCYLESSLVKVAFFRKYDVFFKSPNLKKKNIPNHYPELEIQNSRQ